MELFIHSQTSTVAPLKFGNGQIISLSMWLLIHPGLKVIYFSEKGPRLIKPIWYIKN